jgi:chemotaxis protein histidine kinase CheA
MEFSALAAKETSALLTRVLGTASQTSLKRVDALRTALETAAKALEEAVASTPDIDRDVDELAKKLGKIAAAETDARLKHLSAEARKITDALRAELAEVVGEKEALAISLKDARAQLDALRGELQAEQKQAQTLQKQLAEITASAKKLESARADAVAARDKEATARATAESELHALRSQHDKLAKDAKRALADAEAAVADKRKAEVGFNAANSQAQAAEAKLNAVTTLFKTSAARVQALEREQEQHLATIRELETRPQHTDHVEVAEVDPLPHSMGVLDGLLGAFEALSAATTIGDVLATLSEQLAAEFPRVAMFRVKGNRLEGAHQIGFDLANDIGKVVIPLAMDSSLSRAVTSGRTERLSGDALEASGLPFGGSPTFGVAMPIVVDGETTALVYADDFAEPRFEGHGSDEVNLKFAEALRHHTVALMMRLTTELKTMAELRAYAGSLLTEIEQMYHSDVAAGKEGEELKKRLLANLEYARSIYGNRAQYESPAATAMLDAQVSAMIDAHHDSTFGRDLAVVVEWSAGSRAAEAS